MRYTWRVMLAAIILIANALNYYHLREFSYQIILSLLFNSGIGWIIGLQIDKYILSKKELGATRTVILDYSYAMDSIAEAIGITNEIGQFVFVNEAHAKLYGYSKAEFLTLKWKDCYSKEMLDNLYNTAVPDLLKSGLWKGKLIGVRKDGTTFPQEISLSLIKESQNTICVVRDITEQMSYEKYMKYTAEHNDLTDLPNRRRLLSDLAKINDEVQDTSLLFIDLDHFKLINDNHGHDIGDELLKNVAKRLSAFKNPFVNVYHHGGDEFIVIIQNMDVTYVKNVADEIVTKIKEPYYIYGIEIFITTSIGISRYPDLTSQINDLIKTADTAMYYAKLEGKDTFKIFNKEFDQHSGLTVPNK